MKLRCLNGAHSTLSYLSVVYGIETIAEAMADPLLPRIVRRMWDDDTIQTLPPVPGTDVAAYTVALEERFRNPGVRHRTMQIAMDGSQKLPPRLLEPALFHLRQGRLPKTLALAVAAWMRFVVGTDEQNRPYEIADPLSSRLKAIAQASGRDARRLADELFAVSDIFVPEVAGNAAFRALVTANLAGLLDKGVKETLSGHLRQAAG
jgi:fructuronate reductase